jgi:hypothetical protein
MKQIVNSKGNTTAAYRMSAESLMMIDKIQNVFGANKSSVINQAVLCLYDIRMGQVEALKEISVSK